MSNEIVFYLAHQHGDIMSSVQYVRYIIDNMGENYNFFYIHGKDPESVFIHERVTHYSPGVPFHALEMENMQYFLSRNNIFRDALWIDVWLGKLSGCREVLDENGVQRWIMPNKDGNYVLGENDIFDSILWQQKICNQNIDVINKNFILNFSNKKIKYPKYEDLVKKRNLFPKNKLQADLLLKEISDHEIKIFIANSHTESLQRDNFLYEDYLYDIFDKYPNVAFVFSNNYKNIIMPNVFYIDKYLNIPNLNEIDYMSKYFNVLVTSSSGPGFAIFNDDVFNDPEKTLIYVKRKIIGLYNDQGLCKYVETENYSKENIVDIIVSNIEEKLQ